MFSAQRVRVTKSRVTKRRKPGEELWAIFRRNLDGSEPRYYLSNAPVPVHAPVLSNAPVPVQRPGTCPTPRYLSNAPEDTPLDTLAYVGGSRWRIETEFETEFETEKSDVGLDEYETRTWAGWHHHIALCLLGGAFLLSLQQEWGKKMPRITRPQVYRVVREML